MAAAASPTVARERQVVAWTALLAVSDLPQIVFHHLDAEPPAWLGAAKLAVPALVWAASWARRELAPLRPFAAVMTVFLAALRASAALGAAPGWRALWAGAERSFTFGFLELYARDVGVALAVAIALWWVSGRSRRAAFLCRGDLGAAVEPIRWLGIRAGERWSRFVWIFGGVAAVAVAAVALPSLRPTAGELGRAAPLLPAGLVFAAINALDEEIYFRLALLATLPAAVGRGQAQAMNVVLFGLAHYLAGAPAGIPGALMTGFLAFLMGRAVLETRGLLGAWIIHVLPDAVIFATYAIAWVRP